MKPWLVDLIKSEAQKILRENEKDNQKDDDGDGKMDVEELDSKALLLRKTNLIKSFLGLRICHVLGDRSPRSMHSHSIILSTTSACARFVILDIMPSMRSCRRSKAFRDRVGFR